jgi:hypothetical protein
MWQERPKENLRAAPLRRRRLNLPPLPVVVGAVVGVVMATGIMAALEAVL